MTTTSNPAAATNPAAPATETTTTADGLRPIPEFDGVHDVWPRGARLQAVREAAARAGDVSVVGFDDTSEAEFFHPPLTTVRQDLNDVGRASVALLLELIEGAPPREVRIEPTLVVRASTRPARG